MSRPGFFGGIPKRRGEVNEAKGEEFLKIPGKRVGSDFHVRTNFSTARFEWGLARSCRGRRKGSNKNHPQQSRIEKKFAGGRGGEAHLFAGA